LLRSARNDGSLALSSLPHRCEKEVRRILDPKHPTKLPTLTATFRALGKRLLVGVMEAA
jgi:hypothetical protein